MKPSPFLDEVRAAIRLRHYSIRTEEAYVGWARRFIVFHRKRHPRDMGGAEVAAFLSHLAIAGKVSASTQNQALNALVFLYGQVLGAPLGDVDGIVRAKRPARLPVVLTQAEVASVLQQLDGVHWLVACLLYGSGLRLMEALRLRVKDVDFSHRALVIREAKGGKDRVVTLADELVPVLSRHLSSRRNTFVLDSERGMADVYLPDAIARKYPNAPHEWGWQYVFAARSMSVDPRSGARRRHHLGEKSIQRAIKAAMRAARIVKPASSHTLRHYSDVRTMPSDWVVGIVGSASSLSPGTAGSVRRAA